MIRYHVIRFTIICQLKYVMTEHDKYDKQRYQKLNRGKSRGFNCFRSVLCSSHFLVPLPLLIHKMLLESYEEDIKQISPGTTNHHNPYRDFCRHSIKRVSIHFHPLAIWCNRWHSLRASSPIWASEASRGRTRERAAKRVPLARLLFTKSPEWGACS